MRYLFSTFALFAAIAMSATAQAGPLSALGALTPDGVPDLLQDQDYESLVDIGTPGVSIGDVFVGIFTLDTINSTPTADPPRSTFSGVLVAQIADISPSGRITFTNMSASDYADLKAGVGAFSGATIAGGLSALPSRVSASSALIVYTDTSTPFISQGVQGAALAGQTNWASVNSTSLPSATDGTKVLEFGFTGTTYAQSQLKADNAFDFALALNVTYNGTSLVLGPVSSADSGIGTLDSTVSTLDPLPAAQLHVGGGTNFTDNPLRLPVSQQIRSQTGAFVYSTNASMVINVVPEPGSLTLVGLGALGLLGARFRRRNAA